MSKSFKIRMFVVALANFVLFLFVLPALISAKSTLLVLLGCSLLLASIPMTLVYLQQGGHKFQRKIEK